jgi:hypothetical protein
MARTAGSRADDVNDRQLYFTSRPHGNNTEQPTGDWARPIFTRK